MDLSYIEHRNGNVCSLVIDSRTKPQLISTFRTKGISGNATHVQSLANAPDSDDGDDQCACQGAAPTGHGRARRDGDDPHHDDAVPKNHQCGAKDAKPDRGRRVPALKQSTGLRIQMADRRRHDNLAGL